MKKTIRKVRSYVRYANPIALHRKVTMDHATIIAQQQYISDLRKELKMEEAITKKLWIEPGHFYSPITADTKFKHFQKRSFIPGIDLNAKSQLASLKRMSKYYSEQPFTDHKNKKTRYYFMNDQFSYSDALGLYIMLRDIQPKRVIEVGSGYSSALMLDVNNQFLNDSMKLTFIEPYPTRLKKLLKVKDKALVNIIEKPVQEVPMSVFGKLEAGDILFIDSSHVAKTGSDVNWLYFEVLPNLKPGVLVHVHDIMYPFEYLDSWITQGRSWNEIYLLKALLIENPKFKIMFWPNYLHKFHKKAIQAALPLSKKNPGGSIWLERQ